MSNTSLVLGANWGENEWPDYVDVIHEPSVSHGEFSLSRKYVPELTCRFVDIREIETVYDAWAEKQCSCGEWIDITGMHRPKYCPNCGAKVVE